MSVWRGGFVFLLQYYNMDTSCVANGHSIISMCTLLVCVVCIVVCTTIVGAGNYQRRCEHITQQTQLNQVHYPNSNSIRDDIRSQLIMHHSNIGLADQCREFIIVQFLFIRLQKRVTHRKY